MKKLINIKSSGVIPEMGYLPGPILVPCKVDVEKIKTMLKRGRVIVELNPKNHDEKVKLTLENVELDNFAEKEEHPEEPKNGADKPDEKQEQTVNQTNQQNNQQQDAQKTVNSNQNNKPNKNNKNDKNNSQQKQAEQTPAQEKTEEPKNEDVKPDEKQEQK